METPRAMRPQDVEYQTLLDTAKCLKEKKAEGAERPPFAYQTRQLASLDTQAYLRKFYTRAYRSIRNNPKLHARMWLHANSLRPF